MKASMAEWPHFLTLTGLILGATGLWTFLGHILGHWAQRKWSFARINREKAETRNIDMQAENMLLDNWIQWAQQLESRVKELESVKEKNLELNGKVESQRHRINCLERRVESLMAENLSLRQELLEIKKNGRP